MARIMLLGLAAGLSAALALPAEARGKSPRKAKAAVSERVQPQLESYDCIRANSQDPAGNFRGYPCWARAALSNSARR